MTSGSHSAILVPRSTAGPVRLPPATILAAAIPTSAGPAAPVIPHASPNAPAVTSAPCAPAGRAIVSICEDGPSRPIEPKRAPQAPESVARTPESPNALALRASGPVSASGPSPWVRRSPALRLHPPIGTPPKPSVPTVRARIPTAGLTSARPGDARQGCLPPSSGTLPQPSVPRVAQCATSNRAAGGGMGAALSASNGPAHVGPFSQRPRSRECASRPALGDASQSRRPPTEGAGVVRLRRMWPTSFPTLPLPWPASGSQSLASKPWRSPNLLDGLDSVATSRHPLPAPAALSSTTVPGTPPTIPNRSCSAWQAQTSFSSPKAPHRASSECGNGIGRKCVRTRPPSPAPPNGWSKPARPKPACSVPGAQLSLAYRSGAACLRPLRIPRTLRRADEQLPSWPCSPAGRPHMRLAVWRRSRWQRLSESGIVATSPSYASVLDGLPAPPGLSGEKSPIPQCLRVVGYEAPVTALIPDGECPRSLKSTIPSIWGMPGVIPFRPPVKPQLGTYGRQDGPIGAARACPPAFT